MPKAHETVLEINLKALEHNYNCLKSKLQTDTKFLAVVKAFAYGSEANHIAKKLQDLNVDYFAVAYVSEGIQLRQAGITKPILVLHPQTINFSELIEHCLEPSLYNASILKSFLDLTETKNLENYPVHIKFNTGLNRLGFKKDDIDQIISEIEISSSVYVKSIFSHLAASEDLNEKAFTLNQIEQFEAIAKEFSKKIGYTPMLHICNTSGVLNYPKAHLDMVRSGIGLYGFGNTPKASLDFKPIATLKTIISQIHDIDKGDSVGYNRAFKSVSVTKTATLPIGHADGIGRHYGNGKGFVTIHNQKAPIIGNVCMDMVMVDVSDINCKEGDEVIIFGKSPSAEHLAEAANTISYELITSISQRVKRTFIY